MIGTKQAAAILGVRPGTLTRAIWDGRVPPPVSHDDRHASLSIGRGDDGRVLMHCQAGCAVADVAKALGLTMADLYPANPGPASRAGSNAAKVKLATPKAQIVATYDYRDSAALQRMPPYAAEELAQSAENAAGWSLLCHYRTVPDA